MRPSWGFCRWLLAPGVPALLVLVGGRAGPAFTPRPFAPAQPAAGEPPWSPAVTRRTVRQPHVGPRFDAPDLQESSGLAASARVPGLLWTMNDSGNEPELFALAADDGRVLGRVRVPGARNVDWEALALGPCGGGPNAAPADCLYVGDVGDNAAGGGGTGAGRSRVTLYRVPEPLGVAAGPLPARGAREALGLPASTGPVEALDVRYADGPRDVEAMAVLPNGDTWLITKHPSRRPDGALRPALVYRVGAEAWAGAARAEVAVAQLVDSVPVVPDEAVTNRVTDAAFDADRRLLAVRTYTAVSLVPVAGPPWRVDRRRRATACDVAVLREPQGEGVAFARGPGLALVLSSETNFLGVGGLATAGCPPPG